MITTLNYVPTHVGPSKLDKVLAFCSDLCDESKQRVCIIQDIAKIGKLLGNTPMTPHNFYTLYEMPIAILEAVQHNAQIELNTKQYNDRLRNY